MALSVPDSLPDRLLPKALQPRRQRLVQCLALLTSADERECQQVLFAQRSDPLKAVGAHFFARTGRPWDGVVNPKEAWETVAPDGWFGDEARGFTQTNGPISEVPTDLRSALVFASDPEGMLTTELLAREAASQLTGIFPCETRKVLWRTVDPKRFRSSFTSGAKPQIDELLKALGADRSKGLLPEAIAIETDVRKALLPRIGPCAWDVALLAGWEQQLRIEKKNNPLTPLLGIWETGYAFDHFSLEGIHLVAPSF